jgi:hypothetical protein
VNELALLVHLVVVLAHAVLLVDRVDEGGVPWRLVVAPPGVVQGQKGELRYLYPVVCRVGEQTVFICHRMDLCTLDFQVL